MIITSGKKIFWIKAKLAINVYKDGVPYSMGCRKNQIIE